MDDDQEVAVLIQLNLNEPEDGLNSAWRDDFSALSTLNLSIREGESDQSDLKSNSSVAENRGFQKELEFVKKHAGNADPNLILSLMHSEINNPNRLEHVMIEMLNVPNGAELIRDFRASAEGSESPTEEKAEGGEKVNGAESYLQRIRDMFPDADGLFLISECQQMENWEDFSRFVNTVMLSGVYPKKGVVDVTPKAEPSRAVEVINLGDYRTPGGLSSEDEILVSEEPKKRRRRYNRNSDSSSGSPRGEKLKKWVTPPEVIDVIDLESDTTEIYDFINPGAGLKEEDMEIEAVQNEGKHQDQDGTLNLSGIKFETEAADFELEVGPSVSGTYPLSRRSLPERTASNLDDYFEEKSLAEIIEEKRSPRRKSLASAHLRRFGLSTPRTDFQSPSSKAGSSRRSSFAETWSEVSSPEMSTTSETERAGCEDVEEEPKVSEEWLTEQTANLIRIFPNTDPSYLREEVAKMNGSSDTVNAFVEAKLERNDMPSRAEYEKKQEMEELQNRYTKNFSIEDFLKVVPDPWDYFSKENRSCGKYKNHSLCYLKSAFRKRYVRDIIDTFARNKNNLYLTYKELQKKGSKRRSSRRSEFECNHNRPMTIDIQFLQEVAFIENEDKIRDYLEGEKIAKQIKFDEAKRTGSLLECQCCFDSEILVEDIFYCPKDHAFCRNCIVRAVEVEMGYGRYKFECLASCEEKFTLACLQNVLKPELFSKVIQAIQMEEIMAAGIEDLVQCPFCNYATIMPPEEKVMTCLNPECLKESCRSCKELNHIPLRCDEVEKSEEVKMRTYIENKMTEALVRTCHSCGKKFVKEDGCNKMTCTCGAKMCYVCRKPVFDYSHFNGQGGTEYHKCPLYSTNDELHVELVKRVGEEAKAEVMQANPNTKLLHDPTMVTPERTHQAPMPGVHNGAAIDVAMRALRGDVNDEEGEPNRHHRDRREMRREAPYYNRYYRHRGRGAAADHGHEDHDHHGHHHHNHHHHHHHHHQNHIHQHNHHHFLHHLRRPI